MEVVVPVHRDFHFLAAPTSSNFSDNPFSTFSVSAPTSPRRAAAIFNHHHHSLSSSTIPFDWEEAPGTPKQQNTGDCEETEAEFAFDFSGQLTSPPPISAADELFEAGKIRPLKPPPCLSSPRSPVTPPYRRRGIFKKEDKLDDDPFAAALEKVTRERSVRREANTRKGTSRSLSPLRRRNKEEELAGATPVTSSSTSKKWRLRDLFLFRSASEGRARGGRKEESRCSSFRSTVAVHEYHYAAAEEMKKKTALPYRRNGIFGFLKYNSALSFSRGR